MIRAAALPIAVATLLAGCGREQPAAQEARQGASSGVLAGTAPGVTPMADRVAVIALLNKRNGIVRNLTMRPGQAVRVNDVTVRLRACETTAPWESEKLTGAFLQLDVEGSDRKWRRVFSGWVYKESPSLNVVLHPVYDAWPRSCAMSFPPGPPPPPGATPAPASASNRSSAQRSPGPEAAAPNPPSAPSESPPSAVANNAT